MRDPILPQHHYNTVNGADRDFILNHESELLVRLQYGSLGLGVVVGLAGTFASLAAEVFYWSYVNGLHRSIEEDGGNGGGAVVAVSDIVSAILVSLLPFFPLFFLGFIATAISNAFIPDRTQHSRSFLEEAKLEIEVTFGLGIYLVVCLFLVARDGLMVAGGDGSSSRHLWFAIAMLCAVTLFFAALRYLSWRRRRQCAVTSTLDDMKLGATLNV